MIAAFQLRDDTVIHEDKCFVFESHLSQRIHNTRTIEAMGNSMSNQLLDIQKSTLLLMGSLSSMHFGSEVPEVPVSVPIVSFEPGSDAALQPLYLPGPVGLDRSAL